MKIIDIKDKLTEIGIDLNKDIALGDFDQIGELTAKKSRSPDSELYKSAGCFFRPNYERGILIYSLITKFGLTSFLEIGFGRGYSTFCAAKAFSDMGIQGKIITVDPNFDKEFLQSMSRIFPNNWWSMIQFQQALSKNYLSNLKDESFDLVVLDGDHSEAGVRLDWHLTKDRFNKFLIFDDYHLPPKNDPGIQVTPVVDSIKEYTKEAIIMDRRIFTDDRNLENILDAQVLITK
jgi:predicted O-methyltransferase YrrM